MLLGARQFGTSPREWGKLSDSKECETRARNIPTRVGKTQRQDRTHGEATEHPHASGENIFTRRGTLRPVGTSPREWGKLTEDANRRMHARNIPTRVGKTFYLSEDVLLSPEHPHASGENEKNDALKLEIHGTSPREWGKLCHAGMDSADMRNIPTRVGKTQPRGPRPSSCTEHPHASGENLFCVIVSHSAPGTSPREWGKLRDGRDIIQQGRNIPTRVGKTA